MRCHWMELDRMEELVRYIKMWVMENLRCTKTIVSHTHLMMY